MTYDFDRIIERRHTNSLKWDQQTAMVGATDLLPLWVADMDFAVPPAVTKALKKRAEHPIYGYSVPPDAFYQAVTAWLGTRHQWIVDKDWLLVTPGVVPALSLSMLAFTEPGDRIIIQPPVYPPFFRIVEQNGRQLVLNRLKEENGRYTMDFEQLEKLTDQKVKLMFLCNPHNPVGRVWTKEELMRIGKFCSSRKILLVSDEIHSDLIYQDHTHYPIASLNPEFASNTITCIAPSKTFNIAGLATAIAIIPDQTKRDRFQRLSAALGMEINNTFGLTALTAAYQNGSEWLTALLAYLQDNLDFLLQFFAERIPRIKPVTPEGTFLVWLDCRQLPLAPKELKGFFLNKAKVWLNDGRDFGPEGAGFQRLNIACPRSLLTEALIRIEHAVKQLG